MAPGFPKNHIPPDERSWEAGNGYRLQHDFGKKGTATAGDKTLIRKFEVRAMIRKKFGQDTQLAVMDEVIEKESLAAKSDAEIMKFLEGWAPPAYFVGESGVQCGPAGHDGLESMAIQLGKIPNMAVTRNAGAMKNPRPEIQQAKQVEGGFDNPKY